MFPSLPGEVQPSVTLRVMVWAEAAPAPAIRQAKEAVHARAPARAATRMIFASENTWRGEAAGERPFMSATALASPVPGGDLDSGFRKRLRSRLYLAAEQRITNAPRAPISALERPLIRATNGVAFEAQTQPCRVQFSVDYAPFPGQEKVIWGRNTSRQKPTPKPRWVTTKIAGRCPGETGIRLPIWTWTDATTTAPR